MSKGTKKLVEFIKDFATKKKGEQGSYDPMLARVLINKKVVKFVSEKDILLQELEEERIKDQKKKDALLAKAEKARKSGKAVKVPEEKKENETDDSNPDDIPDDVLGAIIPDEESEEEKETPVE